MKDFVKRLALQRGYLVRKLPGGRQGDAFADQAALLSGRKVRTVFDVGAYAGETAVRYRRLFPNATIHCFEPVPDSFARLAALMAGDPLAVVNPVAVGDRAGPVELHINRSAFTSSTLKPASEAGAYISTELFEEVFNHQVDSTTIDQYCDEHGIDHVDVLKLDIQGAELTALRGAAGMLSRAAISLIYTELLVAPMYEGQAGVGDMLKLYEGNGYRLYGLYDLAYGADTRLFQADAIILSPKFRSEASGQPG